MAAPLYMEWWQALSAAKQACWIVAIVSSLLLSIFLILSLFEKEPEHSPSSRAFITPRAILSFTAVFSWIMLLSLDLLFGFTTSIGLATAAGLLAVLVSRQLSNWINRLGSSPRLLEQEQFLYCTGEVVMPVPPHHNGFGKVRIRIENHQYEMEAMTAGAAIPPGERIRVIAVVEDQTLIVEPLAEAKELEFKAG